MSKGKRSNGRSSFRRSKDHQLLVTADVEPLDVDGVRTVGVGAGLWLLAFLALLPFYGTLESSGRGWWLWTCVAGMGMGLIGVEYCRRRRNRRRSQPPGDLGHSPLGAAGL